VTTCLAVLAALAGSNLIAAVRSRAAQLIGAHTAIATLPLPVDHAATVSMAWHRRIASEPTQAWFRALLTEAVG
jgi:DNA-binding transcriptional LysR family regulator